MFVRNAPCSWCLLLAVIVMIVTPCAAQNENSAQGSPPPKPSIFDKYRLKRDETEKKLSQVMISFSCGQTPSCYVPRSDKVVEADKQRLHDFSVRSDRQYLSATASYRRDFGVHIPDFLARRAADQTAAYENYHVNTLIVSALPPANSATEVVSSLIKDVVKLQSDVSALGFSGLAAYLEGGINQMRAKKDVSVKDAFAFSDDAHVLIDTTSEDLVVSPQIDSTPPGIQITIATPLQAQRNKAEFSGRTNAPGPNLYRGLYWYSTSGPGLKAYAARLNFVDNSGKEVTCTELTAEDHTKYAACNVR